MKYLETSVGNNGKQNVLFPLEYMYITQGENGGYSHQGSYSMDFVGYNASGVVLKNNRKEKVYQRLLIRNKHPKKS